MVMFVAYGPHLSSFRSALFIRQLLCHFCNARSLNALLQGYKFKFRVVKCLLCSTYDSLVLFAGAPQVLRQSGGREVVVARGQDALLRLVVCADPRPRRAAWEWGSLQLEAGADLGRYKAEELAQASDATSPLISLLYCRDLINTSPTYFRRSKPQVGWKNVALLLVLHSNFKRGILKLHSRNGYSTFQ
jgi:hypothetical protein